MSEEKKVNNLELWNSVCVTDAKYTQKADIKGGFTSINAHYTARKATEVFGLYGVGWGLRNVVMDFSILEKTGMINCCAEFFYVIDGEEHKFTIHNSVVAVAKGYPDADWAKKLETGTRSKALSLIGFEADIYMGEFDDPEYMSQHYKNSEVDKNVDQALKLEENKDCLVRYGEETVKELGKIENKQTLKRHKTTVFLKLEKMKHQPGMFELVDKTKLRLFDLYETKLKELVAEEQKETEVDSAQ